MVVVEVVVLLLLLLLFCYYCWYSQPAFSPAAFAPDRGATLTDTETKVPSAEDPQLSKILSLMSEINQNVALHASPTARKSACLMSAFLVHRPPFFLPNFLPPWSDEYHKGWIALSSVSWWIVVFDYFSFFLSFLWFGAVFRLDMTLTVDWALNVKNESRNNWCRVSTTQTSIRSWTFSIP